jgi:hypothetical protein
MYVNYRILYVNGVCRQFHQNRRPNGAGLPPWSGLRSTIKCDLFIYEGDKLQTHVNWMILVKNIHI